MKHPFHSCLQRLIRCALVLVSRHRDDWTLRSKLRSAKCLLLFQPAHPAFLVRDYESRDFKAVHKGHLDVSENDPVPTMAALSLESLLKQAHSVNPGIYCGCSYAVFGEQHAQQRNQVVVVIIDHKHTFAAQFVANLGTKRKF